MSDESLNDRNNRERKERREKRITAQNQRAIRKLKEGARERMTRERAERIAEKKGEEVKKETPIPDQLEKAVEDFIGRIIERKQQEAPKEDAFVGETRTSTVLNPAGNMSNPKDQTSHRLPSIPLEFYCWYKGKIARVEIFARSEPYEI